MDKQLESLKAAAREYIQGISYDDIIAIARDLPQCAAPSIKSEVVQIVSRAISGDKASMKKLSNFFLEHADNLVDSGCSEESFMSFAHAVFWEDKSAG